MSPLAYFLTFHTYGTRLHGAADGSVDRTHNLPGRPYLPVSPAREAARRRLMQHAEFVLDEEGRFVVVEAIRQVCSRRQWDLKAVHARTTHVHVVVTAPCDPEKVMRDLKARAALLLRACGLLGESAAAWTDHGSTRYVKSDHALARAITYTLDEQGDLLPTREPPDWPSVVMRTTRPADNTMARR